MGGKAAPQAGRVNAQKRDDRLCGMRVATAGAVSEMGCGGRQPRFLNRPGDTVDYSSSIDFDSVAAAVTVATTVVTVATVTVAATMRLWWLRRRGFGSGEFPANAGGCPANVQRIPRGFSARRPGDWRYNSRNSRCQVRFARLIYGGRRTIQPAIRRCAARFSGGRRKTGDRRRPAGDRPAICAAPTVSDRATVLGYTIRRRHCSR